jgi:hypothetical protein
MEGEADKYITLVVLYNKKFTHNSSPILSATQAMHQSQQHFRALPSDGLPFE